MPALALLAALASLGSAFAGTLHGNQVGSISCCPVLLAGVSVISLSLPGTKHAWCLPNGVLSGVLEASAQWGQVAKPSDKYRVQQSWGYCQSQCMTQPEALECAQLAGSTLPGCSWQADATLHARMPCPPPANTSASCQLYGMRHPGSTQAAPFYSPGLRLGDVREGAWPRGRRWLICLAVDGWLAA